MSVGLKQSYDIEYNGTANVARMDLFVDTASDLTGLTTFDSITLLQGSTAEDISTGDKYAMQTDGTWVKQPSQSAFANVYTKAEIDSMLYLYYTKTEADALFEWITVKITSDTLPLTFIADGSPLTAWTISGNGQQTGTPTPDAPIMPEFVGTLDSTDWTIPITCAGQTTPIYLGEVPTVRKIRKLVLDGTESWESASSSAFRLTVTDAQGFNTSTIAPVYCTHYTAQVYNDVYNGSAYGISVRGGSTESTRGFAISKGDIAGTSDFKAFLAAQYSNETPVVIWYVLATEQTAIVNEPLCKIGDYADELRSTDAGVSIPTARGANTLTVESELQPSEITITGKIREVTENEQ